MSPHLPSGTEPHTIDEVEALVAQFLAQLQAGGNPNREALVRAHPHLADRLDARLGLAEMIYRVGLAPVEEWPSTAESLNWPGSASGPHARLTRLMGATEVESPVRISAHY